MVARSPPKQPRKMVITPLPIDPNLLRETVKKVDKCMARLQELQYTVTGGAKMVSGVNLSPRSLRNYLRTSIRCKQESLRIKNSNSRRSPPRKLPATNTEEWRRMSLPAMLLEETIGEILQTSQFAKNIVEAVTKNTPIDDPKTPITDRRKQKPNAGDSELLARRRKEKQVLLQSNRTESNVVSSLRRAKSRINFKVSPVRQRECDKENCKYIVNRVSPRNRPWERKTVLFPNPLFHSSPTSLNQKFCKTKSPMIGRKNRETPHKFLIKSPPSVGKLHVKIKSPPISISPIRGTGFGKKSPKVSTAAKLRRSFSPSRMVNKLVSPLRTRKTNVEKSDGMKMMMSGLKQHPRSLSIGFSPRRI